MTNSESENLQEDATGTSADFEIEGDQLTPVDPANTSRHAKAQALRQSLEKYAQKQRRTSVDLGASSLGIGISTDKVDWDAFSAGIESPEAPPSTGTDSVR